ncbi:MAG TPA: asparagine synthase (glutamine-hydrolyzing) [Flammeovirgaceae bacterium]|nr:asparagine synthase (glutamine-hydrolyzing) [Flammeovirgaceae bacterium]
MCGITGIYAFNQVGRLNMINLAAATQALAQRGPDHQGLFHNELVGLGHRRLAVIDPHPEANQPMHDSSGRYVLVFNGEIYNYRSLREQLLKQGITLRTSCDTEVLLYLLITEGVACLPKLNGFFAFAFYDRQRHTLLMARDRYGIKPLHYYLDQDKLLFASELKALYAYGLDKQLDFTTLYTYLQLNYVPAPMSMLKGVKKLLPGHYLLVGEDGVEEKRWYALPPASQTFDGSFAEACRQMRTLLEQAVTDRLVADVPLGTFLSGGIDSSVITALAARHTTQLQSFSIGYADEPFFDETRYARLVADKLGTAHTVFKLTNDDLFANLYAMLDYLDEPFADSSALAVYILSKETRQQVTVALSGDGADELFAGYNKHAAMLKMLQMPPVARLVKSLGPLWGALPQSRHSPLANKWRQLHRFARAARLAPDERYWFLAALGDRQYSARLLGDNMVQVEMATFEDFRKSITGHLQQAGGITPALLADLHLVLPNDMLTKVDMMSMANSLEVRVPFLDHRVVEFATRLPDEMKITSTIRKRVVQEAFRDLLPQALYKRPKKGFEVPLLKWLRHEMRSLISDDLLSDRFVAEQGIFTVPAIRQLKKQLFSVSPGDAHARIWALIVFQWWWKKYFR